MSPTDPLPKTGSVSDGTTSVESPERDLAVRPLSTGMLMAALLIAGLIRLQARTMRLSVLDEAGLGPEAPQAIWCFWHNRALLVPAFYRKLRPKKPGVVFTSASRDGSLLARVVQSFGFESVRGSSSRRGTAALRGLVAHLKQGRDAGVTPDGPRGPCYHLQPGVVTASLLTGVPLLPMRINYDACWRLKSWDRFIIPKPGATATLRLGPLLTCEGRDAEAVEQTRSQLERALLENIDPS